MPDARIAYAIAIIACYLLFCVAVALRHWRQRRVLSRTFANDAGGEAVLVAYASQTGMAERLAMATAETLRQSSVGVRIASLGDVDAAAMQAARLTLFIASTTGEGDPPDSASRFIRRVMAGKIALNGVSYGLLALGDSSYRHFCAFGHQLDQWLRHNGASPLFDLIEVDDGDSGALRHWQASLRLAGADIDMPDWQPPRYSAWRLAERELLNPGSLGGPAYRVALDPPPAEAPQWQAGDIAEIGPVDPLAPDEPHPHREYSIASLPADGRIELIVRQMTRPDGRLGLGSGWLTHHVLPGAEIALRIRGNRAFHPPEDDRPLILIGNGTGLAGLRAHLKHRAARGHHRNWLIFGERSSDRDYFLKDEIESWRASGVIERLDLAFSRDQASRVYVQHRLREAAAGVAAWADAGAAIHVCGSLEGMAAGVDAALKTILGEARVEAMLEAGLYRRDVY